MLNSYERGTNMADKTLTPLTNAEMQAFCSQMSMILKSGISSTEGLSIMLDDSRNTEEQKFLKTASQIGTLQRYKGRSDLCHVVAADPCGQREM